MLSETGGLRVQRVVLWVCDLHMVLLGWLPYGTMFTELLCVQYFILACKGVTLGLRQWAQYEVVCERFQLKGHA